MQQVDNDMDDLFKRAAENYPLNAGKGDWESIAKRLTPQPADDKVAAPLQSKVSTKKIILFSLLLLSLMLGGLMFQHTTTSKIKPINQASDTPQNPGKTVNTPAPKNNVALVGLVAKGLINEDNIETKNGLHKKSSHIIKLNSSTSISLSTGSVSDNDVNENVPIKDAANNHSNIDEPTVLNGNDFAEKQELTPINEAAVTNKPNIVNVNNQLEKESTTPVATNKTQPVNTPAPKKKIFYLGGIAGIDYSKSKSMNYNTPGFTGGVIAGLQLSKRVAIETGITLNKKTYSSEGWQFNMAKVAATMPAGMVVNNLQSKNTVIEIPLNIKYNLISKKSRALFVAAGVSAYIVTKENNHYNVTTNGGPEKLTGMYKHINYRVPAVASISVGYQQPVSKTLFLTIAPVLKIPLQGMGVGSIPVTSAGLQVGITRHLR